MFYNNLLSSLTAKELSRNIQIMNILIKMENYFTLRKQFVNPNILGFSNEEVTVINENPQIFFKCSPKRIILVKWIIDEVESYFKRHNTLSISLELLYDFLRNNFKTTSFNLYNLKKLFNIDKNLEYDNFILIRDNFLKEYNKIYSYSENKNNIGTIEVTDLVIARKNISRSLSEGSNYNNPIINIITKMEEFFNIQQRYINIDTLYFSDEEIQIIDKYPKIFFKCSPKRIVLVKWIIDEIDNYFRSHSTSYIYLKNLHILLQNHFKTNSFNLYNLKKLFNVDNILWENTFIFNKDSILKEYNNMYRYNKNRNNIDKHKSSCFKGKIEIISQIFHEDFLNTENYELHNKAISLSREELEIKKDLQDAKEKLGDELCLYFLKNKDELIYLLNVISHCANLFVNIIELRKAIDNVHETLLLTRIKPLLFAYTINNKKRNELTKLFEDKEVTLVRELPKLLLSSIDSKTLLNLISFIKWLNNDKISIVKREFNNIFKSKRSKSILEIRLLGKTLEETGRTYSLTRERIRQIEKKIINKFKNYLFQLRFHYILLAYSTNDRVLTVESIENQLGELSDIFIYCLKKSKFKEVMWSDMLNAFLIGDRKWYELMSDYVEKMPDRFDFSTLNIYIDDIKKVINSQIENSVIYKYIISNYKLYDKIYSKRPLRKANIYLTVLERFYPNGIKLFDDFEMMRFRNYVKELFGDIDLPENDGAICARIANMTVLCDRGKYILPDRINIDEEILSRIYQFIIDSPKNVIMFRELFERFKMELLEKTNINNHFFLQGVLKYKYKDEFFFTKDVLIKDINNEQNVKLLIEEFIKEQRRVVTKSEIEEEFFGISSVVLQTAVTNNPNILLWDFGSYLHAEQLIIDETTKHRLKRFLDDCTAKGPVSAKEIYNRIYPLENEFLLSNKIYNHIALYSLFRHLFPDDFEFNRSYISPKGSKVTTFNTLIKENLSCFDEIYISDLKDYFQIVRGGNFSLSLFLDDISDEFIRVDKNLLVRKNKLDLSEGIIANIEETTLALLGGSGYISVKKMNDYIFYPDIGIKWTPFLLVSIIKYYSKKLKIINSTADYRRINEMIVDSSLDIGDYDGLLRYALRKEIAYGSFKSMEEVREFLRSEGLISNNIPQSLFEKGWLIEDVCGGITIV